MEGKDKKLKKKKDKKTTADTTDNTTRRNRSRDISEWKEAQKISGEGQTMQTKQGLWKKKKKENSTNKSVANAQGQNNKRMQWKQNNFGVKYGSRKKITEWPNL